MGVSLSRGLYYLLTDLEFADIIFMTLSLLHSVLSIVSSSLPSIVCVHAPCSSLSGSSRRNSAQQSSSWMVWMVWRMRTRGLEAGRKCRVQFFGQNALCIVGTLASFCTREHLIFLPFSRHFGVPHQDRLVHRFATAPYSPRSFFGCPCSSNICWFRRRNYQPVRYVMFLDLRNRYLMLRIECNVLSFNLCGHDIRLVTTTLSLPTSQSRLRLS
ncbi:hypothetical protein F4604DRAFT_1115962 [Suillus subluteus]|nr:hypothetical protein F4604DRAFT_1115962 [Suillus subluteus]